MENSERRIKFTENYAMAIYLMEIAKIYLDTAKDYSEGQVKRIVQNGISGQNNVIGNLTLKLNRESRKWLLEDLKSDDLQALGTILSELVQEPGIEHLENEVINTIRDCRKKLITENPTSYEPGRIAEAV